MNKLKQWIKDHLVPNARDWWKWASIRVNALGLAIMSWVWFDPVSVLAVWNMMPVQVQRELSLEIVAPIAMVFFALAMLSRVVKKGGST